MSRVVFMPNITYKSCYDLFIMLPAGISKGRYCKKIGPQCVRVATAFLFALVCEYGAV